MADVRLLVWLGRVDTAPGQPTRQSPCSRRHWLACGPRVWPVTSSASCRLDGRRVCSHGRADTCSTPVWSRLRPTAKSGRPIQCRDATVAWGWHVRRAWASCIHPGVARGAGDGCGHRVCVCAGRSWPIPHAQSHLATVRIEYCAECFDIPLAIRVAQGILTEYEDRIEQLILSHRAVVAST